MAHYLGVVAVGVLCSTSVQALKTCPGFPGYCSESFPGQTCNVVCSFGRNNVPLCQDDGTWTDIPRCIEHEPGVDEQIPGLCPGISGYCSQGFLNQRCSFDCPTGADINSICSSDGTWQPYPTCEGDLRETRDGCDGCPGPVGNLRNRTAEAILAQSGPTPSRKPNNRIPKEGSIDGGRKQIPSFAGNIKFGPIEQEATLERVNPENQFIVGTDGRIQQRPQQQPRPQPQQQRPRPQPQQPPRQNFQTNFNSNQPPRQQQPRQQQPRQQPPRQQPQFQQGLNTFQATAPRQEPLTSSLFNQIKNRINDGNSRATTGGPSVQGISAPTPGNRNTFGPFESVNLGNSLGGAAPPRPRTQPPAQPRIRPTESNGFFGAFQEVNLQARV